MRLSLVILVLVAVFTTPVSARAQDEAARARALFTEGVEAFDRGEHDDALGLFRQSYAIRRSQAVLYNIAMTERRLGQDAAALGHLYEWLGSDDGRRPARLAEVESEIRELAPRLSTLRLVREPPTLVVEEDGQRLQISSDGIVVLRPGTHSLRFAAEGYAPEERDLSLAAGSDETVRVALTPIEASDPAVSEEEGFGFLFTFIAVGAAAAFGGLAIGAWLAGDAEHQRLVDECAPSCPEDALSTLRTWDALTTVGLVGAGVMTASAIILGLVEGGVFSGDDDDAVSVGPTGATYRRRF